MSIGIIRSRMKNLKDRDVMIVLLIFSFLIRQILNLFIKNPWAMGDELGALSAGAHMAGYDWREVFQSIDTDGSVNFYGGGFGIFLTPLFLLIKNRPYFLYQVILCISSLLQSFSVIISYYTLKNTFAIDSKVFCSVISIGASFFVTSRSTSALNENALILCTWLIVYFVMELIQTESILKKQIFSFILPLILAYSYTIHTRALVLVCSTIFVILFYSLLFKKKFVVYRIFIPSLVLCFVLAMKFNDITLNQVFFLDNSKFANNTGSTATVSVLAGFTELISKGHWRAFGDILVTNILGLSLVTINLFLIVFFLWATDLFKCIKTVIKKQKENIAVETYKYLILGSIMYLCGFGMLFLYSIHGLGNAVNAIETGTCTRSYFYLRYPGAFLGPIITMAGIKLWKLKEATGIKEAIAAVSCAVFCYIYVCLSIVPKIAEHGDGQFDFYHYCAPFYLGKYGQEVLAYHFYITGVVAILLTIFFLLLLYYKKKVLAGLLVMFIFVYQYSYISFQFDRQQAASINGYVYSISELFYNNIELTKKIDTIYWPLIAGSWEAPYVVQFYLPEITVEKRIPKNEKDFMMIVPKYLEKDMIGTKCSWTQLDDVTYIYAKGQDLATLKQLGLVFQDVE